MFKEKLFNEEGVPLFSDLYEKGGRIYSGAIEDSDVTEDYETYLRSIGKSADQLPPFLYRSGSGRILTGMHVDSDITEEWNQWVKTLKAQ